MSLVDKSNSKDNSSRVSVLMAVYNTTFELTKRAIESVLLQDYKNFELIVIDDGTDNDPDQKLLNYIKHLSLNVQYIRKEHSGQSKSINVGIDYSTGSYITIIDADDEYKSNHLTSCMKEMIDADLIASITETIIDHEEDYYVPDKMDPSKMIHVDDCILFATLFGKKEVFKSLNFVDMYAADAHFFERAALQYKIKKVDLKTYVYYRNNQDSICSKLKHTIEKNT